MSLNALRFIKSNEINVSLTLTKDGTEIITRLEIKDLQTNLEGFSRKFIATVLDWWKNH